MALGLKLGLGLTTQRGGGAAAFALTDLFANGEDGTLLLASDMDTLYQDSGGSTPATSSGQTIGRWDDQSGNGNHVEQDTGGDQPLLNQDGSDVWSVRFNGGEYLFNTDGSGLAGLAGGEDTPFTAIILARDSAASEGQFMSWGNSGNTTEFIRLAPSDGGWNVIRRDNSGSNFPNFTAHLSDTDYHIFSMRCDGSVFELFIDGIRVEWDSADGGTISLDQFALGVLWRTGTAEFLTGDITGVLVIDRALSISELQSAESAILGHAGMETMLYDLTPNSNTLVRDTGWVWFNQPNALYDADADLTIAGGITLSGNVIAYGYDHSAGAVVGPVTLHEMFEIDDHDNATFLILPDGRYLTFYSDHTSGHGVSMRRSTEAGSIASWDAEVQIVSPETSYTQPILLEDESNRIYVFYRVATSHRAFITSDDLGDTWSSPQEVISNDPERPYMVLVKNGTGRIDFAFNDGHPNAVSTNSVYHCYYQASDATFRQSDGTLIGGVGDLPVTPSDATLVHDGSTDHSWVWDIHIDGSGNPIIVYAVFVTTNDHRYRYARWNGTSWDDVEVAAAGSSFDESGNEPLYSGGITIADPETLYASREVSGNFEMWVYTSEDGGSTWSGEKLAESVDGIKNVRPVVPRNAHPDIPVIWMAGQYPSFTRYELMAQSPLIVS